ncbi:hypothetical protein VTJ04DRAFT_10267 [Mycothermus thermophilus]|uniref:uncharacterized protein n=1 Tax=Humicola insolens TaxID=85995 RepID=UPI0037428B67
MMSSSRDPTARLRAGLNPLLTASLGGFQHSVNTPVSALSVSSHGAFSSGQTPLSAIQPYNPQEWVSSPIAGPYADPQGSPPPPPPPYSPPRSQRPVSMAFDHPGGGGGGVQAANVSVARAPPPPVQRVDPAPVANTSFPPPPNARGASRERRFGLPSLSRRRDPEPSGSSEQAPPTRSFSSIMARALPGHAAPLTLQIPQRTDSDASQVMAPGARRANSTPAVSTPTSARSRSSSQVRWDPSMPLPPPPPGPPPSALRSQSAQRVSSGSDPIVSPPTRRPPPSGVAALGPVPPTPANWREGDSLPGPPAAPPPPPAPTSEASSTHTATGAVEAVETSSAASGVSGSATSSQRPESTGSTAGGLTRSPAVRGEKAQTLLERRSESRSRAGRGSIDASHRPSEIVIPSPSSGGLQRRLTIGRGTPRSSRNSDPQLDPDSVTPRAMDGSAQMQAGQVTPTRMSPNAVGKQPEHQQQTHHAMAPKALPTPPTGSRSSSSHRGAGMVGPDMPPSAPQSPTYLPLSKQAVLSQTTEQFCRATVERFTAFAQREAAAADDAERVRLFAEFFVSESRIRRERYSAAIAAMGSEILDLTRDLFRPMPADWREAEPTGSEPPSHRTSVGSTSFGQQQQASPSPAPPPPTQNWPSTNYMPSLSPILSMSVSDALDEEDSRGRPASRWWETDSVGAAGGRRLERSKRESKYMGVPKEAREALQWIDDPHPSPAAVAIASSSKNSNSSYPPEKTGWHDVPDPNNNNNAPAPPTTTPPQNPTTQSRSSLVSSTASAPPTPNPAHLDVSRLVTLPPPYPRHHPAVENNHPELAETRSAVRAISDMSEIDAIKTRFAQASKRAREEAAEEARQRRQRVRAHLQEQIAAGKMDYAQAAAAEADAKAEEHAAIRDLEKRDFDEFQAEVVVPLNEILQTRINKATELFDALKSRLFDETRQSNPNLPQEQGDEQPELLEKLTLLKWIFEARETLHRGLFELLSERNDRYRDMVLVPYRLAGETDKVESAEAFFVEDAAKRAQQHAEEVLHRTQEFRDVVEETVVRGVEVQLNAFWDIAPPLKRLLDKIPTEDLEGFQVQIPPAEFAENPSYHAHPLQYLYSLLLHAEKSTYQFIESQTNLLCLLHEVKEACVAAKARAMELDGRDPARVKEMREEEGRRLTEDLKEKVRVVQDQWNSALGETVATVKERVGGWLLETGGWDESFEEGGVGGV